MSDILSRIRESVDEGIEKVTSSSRRALELTKLRSRRRELDSKKKALFQELGEVVYSQLNNGHLNASSLMELHRALKEIHSQTVACERKIEELQQDPDVVGTCTCGGTVYQGAKFCRDCGKNVDHLTAAPQAQGSHCSNCGTTTSEAAKFCAKCGSAVVEAGYSRIRKQNESTNGGT